MNHVYFSSLSPSEFRYVYGLDDDLNDSGHKVSSSPKFELVRRVYRYRDNRYLVTYLPPNAPKDLVDSPEAFGPPSPFKRHNNIVRAQSAIQAIGFCNDWDYFITCTLSPEKFPDRLSLDLFREKLNKLFRRIRNESGCSCQFLLVPELHKNEKGWHMHGLLRDFPASVFRPFELSEHLPHYILGKLARGEEVLDFPRYRNNFGFVDVEPLLSPDQAVSYLCKYVVKGLHNTGSHIPKGKHLYFASFGLKRPELVEENSQYSSSPVLDDLEFDGLVPSFDSDISYEVNGVEQTLGYKIWYEFPSDGSVRSELNDSPSLHSSLYSDLVHGTSSASR